MKRILALIAAGAIAATVAGSASAKGSYTSDNAYIDQPSLNFKQTVTEKGLGKAPVTFTTTGNGFEEFFCSDGSLLDSKTWSSTDEVTITPDKSKASGTLWFYRPSTEKSCSDGSTPYVGYILYSGISVTDNYGNTLTVPDTSQGTRV